jgi:murein DD-endopeptidase MepM/ murein hydrolase activator NlpD
MALGTVTFDRLPLVGGYINGEFREVYDLFGGKYEHGGADLLVSNGQTLGAHVVNPDAYQERAKVYAIKPDDGGDYGNHIILDHQGTHEWSLYAHLQGFAPGLKVGDILKPGQLMGYAGKTGKVTGPHLHWEVVTNRSAPTFGAIRSAPGADGVSRLVAGITLRDPRSFLVMATALTLADLAAKHDSLNTAVGNDRLASQAADLALDSRLAVIERIITAMVQAAPRG